MVDLFSSVAAGVGGPCGWRPPQDRAFLPIDLDKQEILEQFRAGEIMESFKEEKALELEGKIKQKWRNIAIVQFFQPSPFEDFQGRIISFELILLKN